MENKDALLIRKMISLVEQTENKIKNQLIESQIEETENPDELEESVVKTVAADAELLAKTLQAEKGLFQTLKTEVPALSKFKSADELIAALKSGDNTVLNTAERFKILKQVQKVPEVAMKIKGLLSDAKAVQEMGKLAFPKGTQMAADPAKLKIARESLMKSYNVTAKEADDILRSAAQKASGESKVISQFKGKKGGDPALNPNAGKTGSEIAQGAAQTEKTAKGFFDKAKQTVSKYKKDVLEKIKALKGRLSAKQLALYGLAGYGAYELLFGSNGEEKGQEQVIGDCVANLPDVEFVIGTGDVAVAKIPDGVDEKSMGKGGLFFWPNGRVISGDKTIRGNYYCKATGGVGSSIVAGAQSALSESQLNEIDYEGVHIDWDGEKPTPPVPVPTPNPEKSKYTPCSSFPMSFGCKSDKIREIQMCLGMESKYQTGNFGPLTQAKLTSKGLDGSKITEDVYLKILKDCGKTPAPQPTPAPVQPTPTPAPVQPTPTPAPVQPTPTPTVSTGPSTEKQAQIIRDVTDRGADYVYLGVPLSDSELKWMLAYYKAKSINKVKTKNRGQVKYRFK